MFKSDVKCLNDVFKTSYVSTLNMVLFIYIYIYIYIIQLEKFQF